MTATTLRNCLDAAREAILAGETDKAIDLCFHVLCTHPKAVEAHCLLGEAYREKGLTTQAEDTFRRVLSADPENLVARWALALLQEDKGDLDAAALELWRAYELQPGHPELRKELTRLSNHQAFLTSPALGRIYAKGEIYDRAATEFRKVLQSEPDRLDIVVALAETLWRDGKYTEARTHCERALADSPDCLKSNIILGHILSYVGENERAQKLLERANMLDPENASAERLLEGVDVEPLMSRQQVDIPEFEAIETDWDGKPAHPSQSKQPAASHQATMAEADSLFGTPLRFEEALQTEPAFADSAATVHEPSTIFEPVRESLGKMIDRRAEPEPEAVPSADLSQATPEITANETEAAEAAVEGTLEYGDEWKDLLDEEVGLDPESEARLEAALADIVIAAPQSDQLKLNAASEDWKELSPGAVAAGSFGPSVSANESQTAAPLADMKILESTASARLPQVTGEPLDVRDAVTSAPAPEMADYAPPPAPLPEVRNADESGNFKAPAFIGGLSASASDEYLRPFQCKVAENPADYEAHLELAQAYQKVGEVTDAVKEYDLVLKATPEKVDRIIEGLKPIVQTYPEVTAAHRTLGDAYMKIGRFQQAIDCYNRCLNKQQ